MATIYGRGSGTTAWGSGGPDTIFVRGAAAGYGQGGDDRLYGDDAANKLVGGTGNDHLAGAGGADFLDGGDGMDSLDGGAGDDLLWGGGGNDVLDGGAGIDRLRGAAGDDLLRAGDLDEATAGDGRDTLAFRIDGTYQDLWEGEPTDPPAVHALLDGGAGTDTLLVEVGAATMEGLPVARTFVTSRGDNSFSVSVENAEGRNTAVTLAHSVEAIAADPDGPPMDYFGAPTLPGAAIAVSVTATDGADSFLGAAGREVYDAMGGDDWVALGPGGDLVTLGEGADTLLVPALVAGLPTTVYATVTDFDPAHDRIETPGRSPGAFEFADTGDDVLMRADGVEVLFLGVADLDPFIC